MKKLLLLFSLFTSLTLCFAQYDPTIPSQRVPYAKQELKKKVSIINSYLPSQIDEGTILEKVYINPKNGNVVLRYSVDDSAIPLDNFDYTLVKNGLLEQMQYDEANADLYWDVVVLKKNIVHLYVGIYSKKQKAVTLKYDEIRYFRNLAEWL